MRDSRAMWLGALIAAVTSLLLTVLAAALESTINPPGTRSIAPPVLWGLGGGVGLVLGAVVASALTRRAWPGIMAAIIGAVPFTVLVILGYNSSDLKVEDQVVGTLIVVVLPAVLAAMVFAVFAGLLARLIGGRPRRSASPGAPVSSHPGSSSGPASGSSSGSSVTTSAASPATG